MRKFMSIVLSFLAAAAFISCDRRPLTDADYTVNIVFNMDYDIVNYENPVHPELMRVGFFDHETGNLVTHAFLPPEGGQVQVIPGRTYDVLAYSFDTHVTYIENENDFNKITAITNTISDSFKSKLRSRGEKSPDTAATDDEIISYDPDHLWAGRLTEVTLPRRSVDSPEVTLTIDCSTVVQSWILEVDRIKGAQYIGSVSAIITGMSRYSQLSTGERSHEYTSVYFDVSDIDENGFLRARFNTFGPKPDGGVAGSQIVSLVITDTAGKGYVFNADVSDQCVDNKEQIIRIKTGEIDIPVPEGTNTGGLAPYVDEWETIVAEITI